MDFSIFHLDYLGDRLLIGIMGALHVIINHMLAVGGIPLVVALEWWGKRTGDPRWGKLAYRIMFVCFVVATTAGALTGVGLWLSLGLINPDAIGSMLRVFFWAWFTEWIVFVSEVVLILAYFLTWKKWTVERPREHIRLGLVLCVFSWITMAIIVAILGFMMNPGAWNTDRGFWSAYLNPVYLPQLAFRTPLAMVMAGGCGFFFTLLFTKRADEFRPKAIRFMAVWTLAWLPLCAAALVWYAHMVPDAMLANLPVALGTQAYANHSGTILAALAGLGGLVLVILLLGLGKPNWVPRMALVIPMLVVVLFAAVFERSREFVRKPYVIGGYMYANRFRVEDYPLLTHEGILANSTYAAAKRVTATNHVQAGHEVFRLACATCHTVHGMNSIEDKLSSLYRGQRWNKDMVAPILTTLHNNKPFMPPFPGNDAELDALAEYLVSLQPPVASSPSPSSPVAAALPVANGH